MAKEKKRGLFSWLGFGQKKQEAEQTNHAVDEQTPELHTDAKSEAFAREVVDVSEKLTEDDKPRALDADVTKAPEAPLQDEWQAEQERIVREEAEITRADLNKQVEEAKRAEEAARAAEEAKRAEEAARAAEEAKRAEEVARAAEEVKRAEEAARAAEEAKRAEESARAAEEVKRAEEAARAAEEAKRTEEAARAAEEAKRAEESARAAEEAKRAEEAVRAAEEAKRAEEAARAAEEVKRAEEAARAQDGQQEQDKPTKEGFFARLKRSLVKTKQNLGSGFIGLFRGKKIDDDLFEELEEQLLIADVGVETTRKIITHLTEGASRKQLRDAEALYGLLKDEMSGILEKVDGPLNIEGHTPFVILMVGVNGVGKTTTIGKLARQFQQEGKSVMLAAGDTFRAAAVEQLQVWGQRNNIPVVAQHTGADSASVIFDAIQAAKARNIDVLIADTAGRLQNKAHLMEELKKIVRVMKKLDEAAPHEVMLTIDASTGQNAVSQTQLFNEAVGLTGITLTKLDGTAKGGVIFSVADRFGIPIRYIGVGERIEDLRPFNADDFIEALFARED
ncbi:signal recognition particle-docking protein FtsY [Erwinia sp. HR93]|uniref:signal recognition particle-docking protein FtsY n=1 Tax=Erwinia sp. HR93 TaxID=3094840 RepID=UPI002ADED66C|nr:signal recognition particle-docking protein FtsY [Erwinia sp. HR93]MEA1063056.1 signal recognition particle-docking protein FtsY [Erwinia sp. HR93]